MEKDNQHKLDAFFKSAFQKNLGRELPSNDFTEQVLHKLNKTQMSTYKKNEVVFSRRIKWSFGIFMGLVLAVSLYFTVEMPSGSSSYQLPPSLVNLLDYYGSLFRSANNWMMLLSAVGLGFWSLMLLDKIIQKVSFG